MNITPKGVVIFLLIVGTIAIMLLPFVKGAFYNVVHTIAMVFMTYGIVLWFIVFKMKNGM